MFHGSDFSKPLDDDIFDQWLESGRQSKIRYNYLLVIWDQYESGYRPVYLESRDEIETYNTKIGREVLVAVYDLYSESRVLI